MNIFKNINKEDTVGATADQIRSAEATLGLRLPDAYKRLVSYKNGGIPTE